MYMSPQCDQVPLEKLESMIATLDNKFEIEEIYSPMYVQVVCPGGDQHGFLLMVTMVMGHNKCQYIDNLLFDTSHGKLLLRLFLGP